MYTKEHIEKIGNTIVYLLSNMEKVSKTKLLKLIYLLDEISIKKSGIPFLNLEYKVWKFGPVANDLFVEFATSPSMLKSFIQQEHVGKDMYITTDRQFCDDEFSTNELDLLKWVVEKYKDAPQEELIALTHKKHSPWYNAAVKHSVLDALEKEEISTTEIKINLGELIEYDERKMAIYAEYLQSYSYCETVH